MAEGSQATEFAAPDEQEPLDYDAFLSYTTAIADSGRNSEGFGSHRPLGAEQPQRNKRRRGVPVPRRSRSQGTDAPINECGRAGPVSTQAAGTGEPMASEASA
jgi:hypothetical protein